MKKSFICAISGIMFIGCAGGSSFVDTSKLPDTYQCSYMKDVCKEAREYEAQYEQMSSEDKKEFKNILLVYRKQCSDALEQCKKSGQK